MAVIVAIIPQPVKKCQHEASYPRARGDSGAPVFVMVTATDVDLRGIHWGHYPQMTGYKTVYSSLGGIEADLGELQVLAPGSSPPPPSFGATISGPQQVEAYGWGTWTATGQAGQEPYTYEWWQGATHVGSGPVYNGYMAAEGFELSVEITDAAGEVAYGSMWVSPLCPGQTGQVTGPSEMCVA